MREASVAEPTNQGKSEVIFRMVGVGDLVPNPQNPRRRFSAAGLEDLTASVKDKGVLQPLLVRPAASMAFQIVAGERRWRAAKAAGLTEVPARVADLSDDEALEIAVIENIQREDVHPMDEAAGFEALLKQGGRDVAGIAARIGKSEAHVYKRLRLLSLSPTCQKLFLEDKIPASTALLLARIPSLKLQEMALQHGVADVSTARAAEEIKQRFMLTLAEAPFPTDDEGLLPTAGSCLKCPKRTGNQQLLFADVKARDLCTDPPCFQMKANAQVERRLAEAREAGQRVLTPTEAKAAFPHGPHLASKAPFVDLSAKDYSGPGPGKTLRERLGKALDATPIVLAQVKTYSGEVELRELLPRAAFNQIQRELGKPAKNAMDSYARRNKAQAEAQKRRFTVMKQAKALIFAGVVDRKPDLEALRWLARCLAREHHRPDFLTTMGVKKDGQLLERVKALGEQPLQAFLVSLAVERFVDHNGWSYHSDYPDALKDACATFGVDLVALEKAEKDRKVAKAATKAKKPAKGSPKKSPALKKLIEKAKSIQAKRQAKRERAA